MLNGGGRDTEVASCMSNVLVEVFVVGFKGDLGTTTPVERLAEDFRIAQARMHKGLHSAAAAILRGIIHAIV
jgi:hypothetical protein